MADKSKAKVIDMRARMGQMRDTLVNLVSGLGTAKDKSVHTQYVYAPLNQNELNAAYRGDWIARKLVDIPAKDSTREWREWQADKKVITDIEKTEKEFDIQGKLLRAMIMARLYGGAALIMGVQGAGETYEPLDLNRVKKGSLKFVHAVHRYQLGASDIELDLEKANYQLPNLYTVTSASGITRIHYTRVIRLLGNEVPDPSTNGEGWGDSVLQALDDAVRGAGSTIANIASLVHEAKIDIIKIQNLSENLSTQEYADRLIERFGYANQLKSITNTLVLDALEEHERISANFAGFPDLIHTYLQIAAGAGDMPATRFLGQSPKGLNATGENDTRNYYDRLSSEQNSVLRPAITPLDEVIIRHTTGGRDEQITYDWKSLWLMDEAQQADIALKKGQAYQIDVNANLIDANALKIGRENQLIEDGTYPGLEQILEAQEAGEIPMQEEQFAHDPTMNPDHPENKAQTETAIAGAKQAQKQANAPIVPPGKPKSIKKVKDLHGLYSDVIDSDWEKYLFMDATVPRTLYIKRDVINAKEIIKWAKANGIDAPLAPEDMHVTIMYSKTPVDWTKMPDDWYGQIGGDPDAGVPPGGMGIKPGGMRMVDMLGDPAKPAFVLMFTSSTLAARHRALCDAGCSWDWEDYQPHITIAYNVNDQASNFSAYDYPYTGPIILGPEVWEEVDENWKENL